MMKSRHKFIEELFITCDTCGYNNEKSRFEAYGTCLGCGKILDNKIYFKAQMRKQAFKNPRVRDKNKTRAMLYF